MTAATLPARPARDSAAGADSRSGPLPRCPADRTVLDGGPVAYWCPACRRGIPAADLDTDYHPPARRAAP
jgi:hypothetical protein